MVFHLFTFAEPYSLKWNPHGPLIIFILRMYKKKLENITGSDFRHSRMLFYYPLQIHTRTNIPRDIRRTSRITQVRIDKTTNVSSIVECRDTTRLHSRYLGMDKRRAKERQTQCTWVQTRLLNNTNNLQNMRDLVTDSQREREMLCGIETTNQVSWCWIRNCTREQSAYQSVVTLAVVSVVLMTLENSMCV